MKKKLLTALALALPVTAQADIIGLTAGAYSWQQNWEGKVQSGSDSIDLEDDFGYDDDRGNSLYVAFEHPIPLLPNIRVQNTDIEISETNTLTRTVNFEGKDYSASETVDSQTDLSHTDVTLYYELLDNWISLDLGLTGRIFDGSVEVNGSSSGSADFDLDFTLPMLFASARFDLPLTGLYALGEANAIGYSGDTITDMSVALGYEIAVVGVELGYRSFDIDYEDDDEIVDISVDGYFLGVKVDF